ncbi:MAG: hypothetical protein PHS32_14120 [Rhodoferax sp.]|uniref:hypothetical protein n=1 Tax=Rhodoferax sp. TaxID=50421 RepID=UPI00262BB0C5|nr:hypothetical protein [Rhodoferax sp.]MDD5334866.1 hypothetical protein [Rhodoferax sp.]
MTSSVKSCRIGGEFELKCSDLEFDTAANPVLPSFGAPQETWLDTGRSALAVIARHLAHTAEGSTVWLPAYCCESIVAPFLRKSLHVRFYSVGERLNRIDADPSRGDTLLFIHYFGCRNRTALHRIEEFRSASICVIEDCVQAVLTTGIGTHGDHALTSLRKLLPQPDGAMLASRETIAINADAADEEFVSARVVGKLQRGAAARPEAFLPLFERSESRLADDVPRTMSWISQQLLGRTDLPMVAARRTANFATLRQGLADIAPRIGIVPLLPGLDVGEVPLGFPVVVGEGRRDALRAHLAGWGIFCPIHWDLAHLAGAVFAEERALSASMLTLPIDQRYDENDMSIILASLSTFCRDCS